MKPRSMLALGVGAAVILAWAGANSVYTVGQNRQGVLLRLGAPAGVVNAGGSSSGPGLYTKWPLAERVVSFERRVSSVQSDPAEVTTADGGRLAVTATLSYRVTDPVQAFLALGDDPAGAGRLQQVLDTSIVDTLRMARLRDVLADRRAALMQAALSSARRLAAADRLGVEVTDVRLVDAGLPPTEALAAVRRMQDDEARQAAEVRAQGEAQKRELMAQADREALDLRGDGERQALEVRGQGDAQRTAILGAAYGTDPQFARFFRRLEAYDQALSPDTTTLVLSPDSGFLDLFGRGPDAMPQPR